MSERAHTGEVYLQVSPRRDTLPQIGAPEEAGGAGPLSRGRWVTPTYLATGGYRPERVLCSRAPDRAPAGPGSVCGVSGQQCHANASDAPPDSARKSTLCVEGPRGCADCHTSSDGRTEFRIGVPTCQECHEASAPHGDQFVGRECQSCHTGDSFEIDATYVDAHLDELAGNEDLSRYIL